MDVVASFCGLCILLFIGKFLRVNVKLFQKLYLPSSVIGGIVGLIILQSCGDFIPACWTLGWSKLPGFLINIVFAGLFLGVKVPGFKKIWKTAGPQLAYGQIVAWGQYLVGIGVVMLALKPFLPVPDSLGVIGPIGFEGGHGTAGGLSQTFAELGWPEGTDLGLASATVGVVAGIVIGMALINWAVRKNYVSEIKTFADKDYSERTGIYSLDQQPAAGRQTVCPDSIDSLALHIAFLGIAVLIGYFIKFFMGFADSYMPDVVRETRILTSFPLFPLCMIGGLLVQRGAGVMRHESLIDHKLMQRVCGASLDFLVVSAVAMIKLETITNNLLPFIAVVVVTIGWNVFCVLFLARRLLPNFWFERSIAEMGQSMGVTATGLMLLRTVDPDSETEAPAAFGYKQLLHEPFMGGGLWTSMAVPLVIKQGGWLVLIISASAIVIWLIVWYLLWGHNPDFFDRRG